VSVRPTYSTTPPTKVEQEAIAEALSDADALIESLEQLLAKKRHLKQGAMQELLTGKKRLPGLIVSTGPNLMSHLLFSFEGEHWICSTGFCVVRCREGATHPGYVYFHMFAGVVACQIEALLTGSNYPAINSGDVRALQIPFPEYEEQSAIATVLSEMDAELAALESKLAKARQIKQGMMQELLTGRIRLI
jgi:type I restriction enzyme S subunit